ncbi:hypothetical protein DESPIG_01919 [Desulfovibrio piger ATCC 29098]|uniref:Uncharacterized protein n=1 Tax=Desulfovibrio piger ATCC 29098 TaxID=411464 RepID=B6WV04_9BACT|nr:hypothetical protein DESPIG_01919 [Desulfovibrio piger ATCC 29098]
MKKMSYQIPKNTRYAAMMPHGAVTAGPLPHPSVSRARRPAQERLLWSPWQKRY